MPFGSEIARLYVGIFADHTKFDSSMSAVDRKLVGTSQSLTSMGTKLTVGLTAPLIYAGMKMGEFGPEFAALLKLRDLGLVDFVAPRDVEDVATCSVTELGREALSAHR